MKKTLIALALMSIAGTAAAKNVKVQADVYLGNELVGTYTAVVADGLPAAFKDKELLSRLGSKTVTTPEAATHPEDIQLEAQNPDLGFALKMTPRVLADGKILMDAAYTLTTLEGSKVSHDGVMKVEPVTRIRSSETQVIVGKDAPKFPDNFSSRIGDVIVNFSAHEIL